MKAGDVWGNRFSQLWAWCKRRRNLKTDFVNNPFFDQKKNIRFDEAYSEKDFFTDCWFLDKIKDDKLLNDDQVGMIAQFWVRQLEPSDRKIKKVSKETIKYMFALRKIKN